MPRNRGNGYAGYIDPASFLGKGGGEQVVQVAADKYEELVTKATKWDDEHPKTVHLLRENERVNREKDDMLIELRKKLKICETTRGQLKKEIEGHECPEPMELPPEPITEPQESFWDRLWAWFK